MRLPANSATDLEQYTLIGYEASVVVATLGPGCMDASIDTGANISVFVAPYEIITRDSIEQAQISWNFSTIVLPIIKYKKSFSSDGKSRTMPLVHLDLIIGEQKLTALTDLSDATLKKGYDLLVGNEALRQTNFAVSTRTKDIFSLEQSCPDLFFNND